MKTLLSALPLSLLCCLALAAQAPDVHADEPSSSSSKRAKSKKSNKKSRKSNKIESEKGQDVAPEDEVKEPTPEELAKTENALPEPALLPVEQPPTNPSMHDLLSEGGGVPMDQVESDTGVPSGSGGAGGALALGFGLFLVGGGLGAGVMVARQKNRVGLGGLPAQHLKHVKSIRLSPKHQISLIEAQGKQLVVGVTSAQITLLATLEEPGDFADFALDTTPATAPVHSESDGSQHWNDLFTQALKQRDANLSANALPEARKPEQAPKKPVEIAATPDDVAASLPPAVHHASVSLKPAEEQENIVSVPEADAASSVVTETEEYTLEEPLPDVPSHDGMFAEHDAVHHANTPAPSATQSTEIRRQARAKTRRSRESDSMLIALAAMREEASR